MGFPLNRLMERMAGREGDLVTVNGQVNPPVRIQRDGWIRLRILNASSSRFYRLQLEEHLLYLIATDAGALPAPDQRDEILLTPGERIEVMVRGERPEGKYRLLSLPYNRGGMGMGMMGGVGGTTSRTIVLATVVYEGQAGRTWSLPQQLVRVDPLPAPSVRRSFLLGQGMGMGMMGGGGMTFTINGRTFNPNRVDTLVALARRGVGVHQPDDDGSPDAHSHEPFQCSAPMIRRFGLERRHLVGANSREFDWFRDYTGAISCHIWP
jgi:FtsP/CotA-like multicopper oxidase with cupredoxin domain